VIDGRGYGCSERFSPDDVAPLEVFVDDLVLLLDALGIERTASLPTRRRTSLPSS
jgi:pimeloyl-ACP methyl ester carboxylesterase